MTELQIKNNLPDYFDLGDDRTDYYTPSRIFVQVVCERIRLELKLDQDEQTIFDLLMAGM